MSRTYLVATFPDSHRLLTAVGNARNAQFRIQDVYTPYPIHDLDHAMGLRRTRLPLVTLVAGAMALSIALFFQSYAAVLDWPLNVGGKPDNSSLAFVPICFEATVLIGGLATFAALLLRARLYPGKRVQLVAAGVTNDTIALVLRTGDDRVDINRARQLLEISGASEVEEIEGSL